MAFPRLSLTLVATVMVFLCWTTSSAQSHDRSPAGLSTIRRVKRAYELDATTKERTQSGSQIIIDSAVAVTQALDTFKPKMLAGIMNGLAKFASLAPGIGSLVSSIINVVLAIIPQENAIEELRKGFAEVNRRLDALSVQISDLATDVEWFNYVSIYSQDENRILNAWRKFDDFRKNSRLVNNEERLRLAEHFSNFYENTATEGSVSNIYRYLTVSDTSLNRNLNDLLKDKFKCSISEIGQYNMYFSGLLWRGMVLNQFYWNLIGFNASQKQDEHNEMFKNVSRVQNETLQSCLDRVPKDIIEDVKVASGAYSPNQRQDIANKVKTTLDTKYFWYNWVVMVYDKGDKENYELIEMNNTTVENNIVAFGYTQRTRPEYTKEVVDAIRSCLKNVQCHDVKKKSRECRFNWQHDNSGSYESRSMKFDEHGKVLYAFYHKKPPAKAPQPYDQSVECIWGNNYRYKMSIYLAKREKVCTSNAKCSYRGRCRPLMESNEFLCDCYDGYYGDKCEKKTNTRKAQITNITVPDITTVNNKINQIQVKLDELLRKRPA